MWKITALDLGDLNVPRSNMLCSAPSTERIDVPVIAWLLTERATGRRILVDSGASDEPNWGETYHNPLHRARANQFLPIALAEQGVDPMAIDTVILTHLHWDHAYGVCHLPNARVIVQRRELLYAIDPTHKDAKIYETTLSGRQPFFFRYYTRLEVIDGVADVGNGIRLLPLPGHSPGSQGVLVDTEAGRWLIAGDLINVLENLSEKTPGSLYTDMEVCQSSFEKAAAAADLVLPAHDRRAFALVKKLP